MGRAYFLVIISLSRSSLLASQTMNFPFNFFYQEQLAVRTVFRNSSTTKNSKYGRRYEAEWLLECLLIRIKSKTTYEHLRTKKLLPLPHPDTLQKMLSCMSCSFGFNDFALSAIQKKFSRKKIK